MLKTNLNFELLLRIMLMNVCIYTWRYNFLSVYLALKFVQYKCKVSNLCSQQNLKQTINRVAEQLDLLVKQPIALLGAGKIRQRKQIHTFVNTMICCMFTIFISLFQIFKDIVSILLFTLNLPPCYPRCFKQNNTYVERSG